MISVENAGEDADGGHDAQQQTSRAGVGGEVAPEDETGDRERGGGDHQASGQADHSVEEDGCRVRPRALPDFGRRGHGANGGARNAVAKHEQVAGQGGDESIRPKLRDGQAPCEQSDHGEEREQAARLRDLLKQHAGGE